MLRVLEDSRGPVRYITPFLMIPSPLSAKSGHDQVGEQSLAKPPLQTPTRRSIIAVLRARQHPPKTLFYNLPYSKTECGRDSLQNY